MKFKDIFYTLLLLACLGLSIVVADRSNIIEDPRNRQHFKAPLQGPGRRRDHIVTFVDGAGDQKVKTRHDDNTDDKHFIKEEPAATTQPTTPTKVITEKRNDNDTKSGPQGKGLNLNVDFIDMHTIFYILLAVSAVVIGYFVIKIVRSKSRRKTKKYGVLGQEVELTPLDQDDEDEDMTVFDANSK